MKLKIGCGILMLLFLTGLYVFWIECNTTKTYELGKIPIKGIRNHTMTFKQVHEPIEPVATVYASILYKDKYVDGFVFGSYDFDRRNTSDFTAKCKDSIVYLIFKDSVLWDYYDLKKRKIPFETVHSFLLKNDNQIKSIH